MSSETTPTKPLGSEGQTYLVGDSLYLRGLQPDDARRASAWRQSLFPVPAARAEEILKDIEGGATSSRMIRLLACHRADDEPVGLVTIRMDDWQAGDLSLAIDPVFGAHVPTMKTELLRLVVPWLRHEVDRLVIWIWITAAPAEEPLRVAANELGLREVGRFREAVWRDGARHDTGVYEWISPVLAEGFGTAADDGTAAQLPTPIARGPRPRPVWPEHPPRNAALVGQRVYLRPLETEDAALLALWSRRETDTFHEHRIPVGPVPFEKSIKDVTKPDVPSWIRFGTALRENDELIGALGLSEIDWVSRAGETESAIFRPEYRSKGYGTEAKELLLWYVFARLGFHMVRSFVWSPNGRSAKALLKQGYRPAGRIHYSGFHLGRPADDLLFDLLASEWAADGGAAS